MLKKVTLVTVAALGICASGHTQGIGRFPAGDRLDIGNISAPHLLNGDMWWNPGTGTPSMQFPKGDTAQISGIGTIWAAAYDAQGSLRVAAQGVASASPEQQPGPVDLNGYPDALQKSAAWARIWKINSATIDSFLKISSHTIANTPASILEWPGNGNTYAKGANGVALSIAGNMAPFGDVNSNGVYEPLAGDYPKMKGSQMLWWILNDANPHTVSATMPLNIEIRVSAYAYAKGTLTDNILFYDYDVNATENSPALYNFVFASMADLDIGFPFDDIPGYDSGRRMSVTYDYGNTYQTRHVGAGFMLLEQPGDSRTQQVPAGSMTYFQNVAPSKLSDPRTGVDFYNYMTGKDRLGNPYPNGRYAFPMLNSCGSGLPAIDARVVLSAEPAVLPMQTIHYAYALVLADSVGTCPNPDFSVLEQTADSAKSQYWNPARITPRSVSVPTTVAGTATNDLSVFPNPAGDLLKIEGTFSSEARVIVTNVLGTRIEAPLTRTAKGFELITSTLPPSMYYIRIADGAARMSKSFIKR